MYGKQPESRLLRVLAANPLWASVYQGRRINASDYTRSSVERDLDFGGDEAEDRRSTDPPLHLAVCGVLAIMDFVVLSPRGRRPPGTVPMFLA